MAFIGTGTTMTFATGFFAEILDISPPAGARESIQTSHMLTTVAHTFTPAKLVDWGEVNIEFAFFPSEDPPIDDPAEGVVITFSNSSTATWAFDGFMTGYEPSVPLEERSSGSATLKVSGDVTVA